MATEQVIHLRGWIEPDPELETRIIEIGRIISCAEVESPGLPGFYRITFTDRFGINRIMEVESEWMKEIMSGQSKQIMLTIRKVVVSVQIVFRYPDCLFGEAYR